jgi:hypothetical protein
VTPADGDIWLGVFDDLVPAGAEGSSFLDAIPTAVPERGEPGRNAARERYCLVAALRWFVREKPGLFPARVSRKFLNQAPDFLLHSGGSGGVIALEHTDAGPRVFQRWMDTHNDDQVAMLPSPAGRGWLGDKPEQSSCKQLAMAICRKRNSWRDAPPGGSRVIILYDNTSTSIFVDDTSVAGLLREACVNAAWGCLPDEGIMVVRSSGNVFVGGALNTISFRAE